MNVTHTQDPTLHSRHPNLAVVVRAGEAIADGFRTPPDDLFAEDFVLHYYNRQLPDLAGDYHGLSGLRGFFERLAAVSGGTFRVTPRSLTPFGDELAVAHGVDTLTVDDSELELDALIVWRVVGGRIREAWDIPAVNTIRQPQTIGHA